MYCRATVNIIPRNAIECDNKVRYRGGWNSTISRFRLKSETMRTYLIVHSLISAFIKKLSMQVNHFRAIAKND